MKADRVLEISPDSFVVNQETRDNLNSIVLTLIGKSLVCFGFDELMLD